MPRCSYTHETFFKYSLSAYPHDISNEYDISNQCWISDVGNFGSKESPEYRCVLHAPQDKDPIDRTDWRIAARKSKQSEKLRALLDEWSADNKSYERNYFRNAFVLPGLNCGAINLSGNNFSEGIIFDFAIFSGDVTFSSSTFNADSSFKSVVFKGNVGFDSSTFDRDACFDSAIFSKDVSFKSVTFNNNAVFGDATFGKFACFNSAIFSGHADFDSATFSDPIDFKSAIFRGRATFEYALITNIVDFESASFNGDTIFASTVFSYGAFFKSTTFIGYTTFSSATFNHETLFLNTTFDSTTIFQDCRFKFAPQFHNAKLHQDTDFRGAKFEDKTSYYAPAAYRTLKLAMGKVQSRKEEANFFAYEQESLRHQNDTPPSVKISSALYSMLSDYGRNFVRPLGWLLGITSGFMLLYSVLLKIDVKPIEQYPFVIQFTIEQVVRPFNIWTTKGAEKISTMIDGNILLFQSIATVQSLLSITIITLFLLAVRRHFKLS
ncbi:MAG: pentapeptide repeat-containing protein [Gammaproteobacteria bacterium]|nr:pentapeptide repeat-containing protein [Gammaproteobacteria bacterium]